MRTKITFYLDEERDADLIRRLKKETGKGHGARSLYIRGKLRDENPESPEDPPVDKVDVTKWTFNK